MDPVQTKASQVSPTNSPIDNENANDAVNQTSEVALGSRIEEVTSTLTPATANEVGPSNAAITQRNLQITQSIDDIDEDFVRLRDELRAIGPSNGFQFFKMIKTDDHVGFGFKSNLVYHLGILARSYKEHGLKICSNGEILIDKACDCVPEIVDKFLNFEWKKHSRHDAKLAWVCGERLRTIDKDTVLPKGEGIILRIVFAGRDENGRPVLLCNKGSLKQILAQDLDAFFQKASYSPKLSIVEINIIWGGIVEVAVPCPLMRFSKKIEAFCEKREAPQNPYGIGVCRKFTFNNFQEKVMQKLDRCAPEYKANVKFLGDLLTAVEDEKKFYLLKNYFVDLCLNGAFFHKEGTCAGELVSCSEKEKTDFIKNFKKLADVLKESRMLRELVCTTLIAKKFFASNGKLFNIIIRSEGVAVAQRFFAFTHYFSPFRGNSEKSSLQWAIDSANLGVRVSSFSDGASGSVVLTARNRSALIDIFGAFAEFAFSVIFFDESNGYNANLVITENCRTNPASNVLKEMGGGTDYRESLLANEILDRFVTKWGHNIGTALQKFGIFPTENIVLTNPYNDLSLRKDLKVKFPYLVLDNDNERFLEKPNNPKYFSKYSEELGIIFIVIAKHILNVIPEGHPVIPFVIKLSEILEKLSDSGDFFSQARTLPFEKINEMGMQASSQSNLPSGLLDDMLKWFNMGPHVSPSLLIFFANIFQFSIKEVNDAVENLYSSKIFDYVNSIMLNDVEMFVSSPEVRGVVGQYFSMLATGTHISPEMPFRRNLKPGERSQRNINDVRYLIEQTEPTPEEIERAQLWMKKADEILKHRQEIGNTNKGVDNDNNNNNPEGRGKDLDEKSKFIDDAA